jgi:hypothetical protein
MEQVWSPRVAKYHLAAIVLVTVLTHGLLLLIDGVYWDGRLLYSHLSTQNWPALRDWFGQAGLIFFEEFYRAVGMFPGIVFGYRLAAFLSMLLSAVVCYLICRESKMVSPWEGLFISLIQLTFPAFRVSFCIILLPYLVCYLLFLTGVYLAIRSHIAGGRAGLALRLLALGCLFLSYSTNSLMVFYFGFLLFMVLLFSREKHVPLLAGAKGYLLRNIDFVILPFVYWGIKEAFFPRYGVYAHYNEINLSPVGLVKCPARFVLFVLNAVVLQVNEALAVLVGVPLALLVLATAFLWLFSRRDLEAPAFFGGAARPLRMAAFGLVLLTLGILPYVLVGKVATFNLWTTRHSLLVGPGVALVIVAIAKGLAACGQRRALHGSLAFLATLVLAFTVTMVSNYLHWQARWVKDSSVMLHLSEMPPCKANTYWIDDRFPLVGQEPYRPYEWASVFKEVWGGTSRTGLPKVRDMGKSFRQYLEEQGNFFDRMHNLNDYDPQGPQAVIAIRPGPFTGSELELVVWYWFYKLASRNEVEFVVQRWFHKSPKQKFDEFRRNVTEVSLEMVADGRSGAGVSLSDEKGG